MLAVPSKAVPLFCGLDFFTVHFLFIWLNIKFLKLYVYPELMLAGVTAFSFLSLYVFWVKMLWVKGDCTKGADSKHDPF